MDWFRELIDAWIGSLLSDGIKGNLSGLFDGLNEEVAGVAGQVSLTPLQWNSDIFDMIQQLSETVILPIAGLVLAFIACTELIQLITDKNSMHEIDTWIFFKWFFKTAIAVLLVTNTWNIVMGVFDVGQFVVNSASGVIIQETAMDISSVMDGIDDVLAEMSSGELLGLWFQTLVVQLAMVAIRIVVFIIIVGRVIEIYLVTSIAPIPIATMVNREWGQMGQNYLKSLLALAFQGFLIMVCVAIYAVLIQGIALNPEDISMSIWWCLGYTALLCFTLLKTSSMAKSIFNAH